MTTGHPNSEAALQKPYFAALDGLRAISVFLVISYHVRIRAHWLVHIPGQLGVEIFFVLSGYLITTLLIKEQRTAGKIDLSAFYTRRFFRIVPVYLVVLGVYLITCHHDPSKWVQLSAALPYYFTFTNEWLPFGAPFGFSWTLGIEEKFYLIWPLFYFVVLRARARLIALPLLYMTFVFFLPYRMGRSYSGLLVGCLLALLLSTDGSVGLKRVLAKIPAAFFFASVIFGFYLVDRDVRFTFLFSWLVAALIANLQLHRSWLSGALAAKWLTWIGRRSYGMYLVHGLVIDVVQSIVRPTNSFRQISVILFTYFGAALVAEPVFRFIEEPARRYGKALIERRALSRSPGLNISSTPANLTGVRAEPSGV
jgi:peptidoglycan/LPS O-acetylase OafA/YrhL